MLALGWAVGSGSTPVDTWFAENLRAVVGTNPRWLLAFTSWWLVSAVLVACLAVTVCRREWHLAVAVAASPLVANAINSGLKQLFERRNGRYLEYPSGHTTLLVVALGMLVVVSADRRWVVAIAAAVSLLGMLGLVGCGYHYFTDTIGAALLASALVCLAAPLAGRRVGLTPPHTLAALALVCATGSGTSAVSFASPTDARAAGLVDVRSVVPSAIIDLRYATPNNFLRTPLYPPDARCLVHESLTAGLRAAADALRRQGRDLVFWDCYRPHDVQARMFEAVPDPTWVARPGPFARSHLAGRSVDVTTTDPAAQCPAAQRASGICLSDMGTDFDDFSPRASAFGTEGISQPAAANRALLRDAMSAGGFTAYPAEWWHFDGPGAGVQRPILDVAVN